VILFYPDPLNIFITRNIAASSDIILLRPFSHIINLIHVINTRSIRMFSKLIQLARLGTNVLAYL